MNKGNDLEFQGHAKISPLDSLTPKTNSYITSLKIGREVKHLGCNYPLAVNVGRNSLDLGVNSTFTRVLIKRSETSITSMLHCMSGSF